ncbi:MAG: ABC transporter ATP-binding protein, partial [Sedimentisphaerales bacterium]|nr:ABC transporter ATP-binding protein [Sedimentisphaerales bacterium]
MPTALSIQNLTKVYKNGVVALQGIDLTVEQGDFFALLGPNGAGKSTTIGIISSLVNKSAGTVKVFGHDLDSDLAVAKACIGLVPQEYNFNQFEPVIEILASQAGYYGIPRPLALERAELYLNQLGLWEKRHEHARNLSGGMKRRLMIARALVHEPRLLILDEPTAGVDIEIRHSMWNFLREINAAGTTIILTTHYLEEAEQLCRNIAIIDNGRIVENTSMRQLLSRMDTYTLVLDLALPMTLVPVLRGFTTSLMDGHTLEVVVPGHIGITALFTVLSQQNIDVRSLRNKTNRLEELFIRLVGNK